MSQHHLPINKCSLYYVYVMLLHFFMPMSKLQVHANSLRILSQYKIAKCCLYIKLASHELHLHVICILVSNYCCLFVKKSSSGSSNLQSQKEVASKPWVAKFSFRNPWLTCFVQSYIFGCLFLTLTFKVFTRAISCILCVTVCYWVPALKRKTNKKKTVVFFMEWSGTSEVWRAFSFKALFHLLGRAGRYFRWLLCMGEVLCHYLKFGGGGEDRDERRAIDGLGKDGQIGERGWL